MMTASNKLLRYERPARSLPWLRQLLAVAVLLSSGVAAAAVVPDGDGWIDMERAGAWVREEALVANTTDESPQSQTPGGMRALGEEEMSQVVGQSLMIADVIQGEANTHGLDQSDKTFYRIGMDAELDFNLNIDKLQLGCGGFNEGVVADACDLDVDFLTFTGSDGPDDDFTMTQPYLELAIHEDGDRTRREIAGIKIGSAAADGVMSIGRRYAQGAVNQEHGLENGQACGNTQSTQDDGSRLACSSGANRMSGFLLGEFSAVGEIDDYGGADVCMGWTSANDHCPEQHAMFATFSGTRMERIGLFGNDDELRLDNCGFTLSLLGCPNANFKLSQSLRSLHDVRLTAGAEGAPASERRVTRDLFISFQRERIAWPIFDQDNPYGTVGPPESVGTNRPGGEAGWDTSRFSAPANTGWWMNITYADATDLDVGVMEMGGFGDALDALSAGGSLEDTNLGMVPIDNCYGTAQFC